MALMGESSSPRRASTLNASVTHAYVDSLHTYMTTATATYTRFSLMRESEVFANVERLPTAARRRANMDELVLRAACTHSVTMPVW